MTVPAACAAKTDDDRAAMRAILHRLKEKLDNVAADLYDLAAALESPGKVVQLAAELGEDQAAEDELRCSTCGSPVGIFLGHGGGWHHWRGKGTAESPVELYDAGHEPSVAWRLAGAR
jgi:hypothetical protein